MKEFAASSKSYRIGRCIVWAAIQRKITIAEVPMDWAQVRRIGRIGGLERRVRDTGHR